MDSVKAQNIPQGDGRPERQYYSKVWNGFNNGIEQYYGQQRNTSDTVRFAKNMCSGEDVGTIVKRLGYSIYGNQGTAGKTVLGLHQMQPYNTSYWRQLRVIDGATNTGTVQYYNAGTWTADDWATITTGAQVNFINFRERTYGFHGGTPYSWDGNTGNNWLTGASGFLDGCASAYYAATYNSRIYTVGSSANPDRGQFSCLPTDVANWGITTFTADRDFYSLDGRAYTGVSRTPKGDRLILLTYDNCYLGVYNDSDLIFEQYLIEEVGTSSHRSVVNYDVATFWYHPEHGFVRFVAGEKPSIISDPVKRIVEAILPANYSKVCGSFLSDSLFWSIGNVSFTEYDGRTVTSNNSLLRFDVGENAWWLYEFADSVDVIARMRTATEKQKLYFGNNDAEVFNMEAEGVYTDNLAAIECEFVTKRYYGETDDHPYRKKRFYNLQGITVSPSMKVQLRTSKQAEWGENSNPLEGLRITESVLSDEINDIPLGNGLEGDYVELRCYEGSKDFCGIENIKLDYKVLDKRRTQV